MQEVLQNLATSSRGLQEDDDTFDLGDSFEGTDEEKSFGSKDDDAQSDFFGNGEAAQIEGGNSEEDEVSISTEILMMLAMLMIAITCGHWLKKSGHKYLQESGLTVLLGVVAGALCKVFKVEYYMTNMSRHFSTLFLLLLLPPIIFEAGYNMNKKPFFANFGSILAYSFLGTFIAIFTSAGLFWLVGQTDLSPEFTWKDSFAFGSLISATDPVSVLAVFKEMDADVNLYAIVFGESIFNDAIGLVMYETVLKMGGDDKSLKADLLGAFADFFVIFIGSIIIGALMAFLTAYILKRQSTERTSQMNQSSSQQTFQHQRQQEQDYSNESVTSQISMMVMCPWVCYLIAEGLKLSGIVAICTNGVFLNAYAQQNVTRDARRVLRLCYETVAVTAEQIVFLFLGIGLFAFNHPYDKMGVGLALTTILNLNVARFLNIFIVTFLVNCGRSEQNKIPLKMQFTMWIAGLRGAMAYALALKCATDLDVGPIILIDTLIYAFITILATGSILNPLLSKLNVKRKDMSELENDSQPSHEQTCADRVKARLSYFNQSKIAPIFVNLENKEVDGMMGTDIFSELPVTETWSESMNRNSLIQGQPHQLIGRQDHRSYEMELQPVDKKKRKGSGSLSSSGGGSKAATSTQSSESIESANEFRQL